MQNAAKTEEFSKPAFTPEALDAHQRMLEERVFQVETKWPQFRLLIADMRRLADEMPEGAQVVSLERTLLYGGLSLFAPFFHRQDFISVDCSPDSAQGRGAYNSTMVDDPRCLAVPMRHRGQPEKTGLPSGHADLVLVPNLVHHVRDQQGLFAEMVRLLRPGGRGYIFEPLVRELHQAPDDYVRYTPWGFEEQLRAAGLVFDRHEAEGGPFTAIAYCWTQALEYFPPDKRADMERWFYGTHMKELVAWDTEHRDNHVRRHTTFPTAFSIYFHKPE